jgi:VEFS-Box of polycomb protein
MTDVSMREKHFMSHWNNFMRSHPIVSEIQLSSQVESFVRENSSVIFESKLEGELMAHLTNMWVEGHIGQWTMLEIMKGYDSYVKQRSK